MYPSTSDLVDASTVEALTALTPDQQDALRAAAITSVEAYCRQSFLSDGSSGEPVRRTLDGTGTRELMLPGRLSELTSVTVDGTAISADSVTLSDDRSTLVLDGFGAGTTWADRALADARGHSDPLFDAGSGNITIEGVWGWTDDEYDTDLMAVTTALRYDMEDKALAGAHQLADTIRAARALGAKSVNQGRISIDLSGTEAVLSARAKAVLANLRFVGGAGAAF